MRKIAYEVSQFVSSSAGTLPVVLTCPHDGEEDPPGVPERSGAGPCLHFNKVRDLYTREITEGVAQRMLEISGEAPYVVVAEFSRKYIDANREPACAYEQPSDAAQFYDEYHGKIRQFVNDVRADSGGAGLLFDIHGTDNEGADIYLGTKCGSTIKHLLDADAQAMWRRRSLGSLLRSAGYAVLPEPGSHKTSLSGGYTVETYGSSRPDGVDAIQVEVGAPLRKEPAKRSDLIDVIAFAIHSLVLRYATTQTIGTFSSIQLLGGESATLSGQIGQLAAGDATARFGGAPALRGRVEIRQDPGVPDDAATRRAGVLVLYGEQGEAHHLWVDNRGDLRISLSDPLGSGLSGVVVGSQS